MLIRNDIPVKFISEKELKNRMEIDKFMDTRPDEIPEEYDINPSPKRILDEHGYITIGTDYHKTNLTAWQYMMKILGFKIK